MSKIVENTKVEFNWLLGGTKKIISTPDQLTIEQLCKPPYLLGSLPAVFASTLHLRCFL